MRNSLEGPLSSSPPIITSSQFRRSRGFFVTSKQSCRLFFFLFLAFSAPRPQRALDSSETPIIIHSSLCRRSSRLSAEKRVYKKGFAHQNRSLPSKSPIFFLFTLFKSKLRKKDSLFLHIRSGNFRPSIRNERQVLPQRNRVEGDLDFEVSIRFLFFYFWNPCGLFSLGICFSLSGF